MFLKRLKLTNYRKFSSEKNIVEFISSQIVLNQDNDDINDNFEENSVQNDCDEIDVASDTTLIIGKNNAGKTTIITALDNLINHNNAFGANDFNYRYLQEYLDCYDACNPPLGAPYIEIVLTIGLEEDSNDRISNLDRIAADEATEQKTLSEREQKIYNMICENLHLSVEQVMAELDISRSTVFRDYAKIKKVTGAVYDKKTSTWTL